MKTRVLLVGCGEHSLENLVPSLAGIESVQVDAVSDPNPEAVDRVRRWFPNSRALTQAQIAPEELSNIDAVVVAAPPQIHEQISAIAIEHGKPIFVEKPPAVFTVELEKLAAQASKKQVITCVGHNLRHSEAAIQFRNAVIAPQFGRPVAMEMRYFASKPRGTRWGLHSTLRSFLLSHANHAIDLMIYQMGDIKEVVAARAWPDVDGGTSISAQFVFTSGAVGALLASSYAPQFTIAATVISDAGFIAELTGLHSVEVRHQHEMGKRWSDSWAPRTLETGFRFAGYQTQLERFFMAIKNKSPQSVHPSFQDEVAIYRAMDAMEKSIEGAKQPG